MPSQQNNPLRWRRSLLGPVVVFAFVKKVCSQVDICSLHAFACFVDLSRVSPSPFCPLKRCASHLGPSVSICSKINVLLVTEHPLQCESRAVVRLQIVCCNLPAFISPSVVSARYLDWIPKPPLIANLESCSFCRCQPAFALNAHHATWSGLESLE